MLRRRYHYYTPLIIAELLPLRRRYVFATLLFRMSLLLRYDDYAFAILPLRFSSLLLCYAAITPLSSSFTMPPMPYFAVVYFATTTMGITAAFAAGSAMPDVAATPLILPPLPRAMALRAPVFFCFMLMLAT